LEEDVDAARGIVVAVVGGAIFWLTFAAVSIVLIVK
jgi:hypothetical protein